MKVLIVDDNPINLQLMSSIIERLENCEPVCIALPERAITWLETEIPDLILLDQMMPEIAGIDILRLIRADPRLKQIPVVMVTGTSADHLRLSALEEGATDFVQKPIRPVEFRARIRNLIALREHQCLLQDRAALLAHEVAVATRELRERELELVIRLCRAAEFRDPETGAHLDRMSRYSRLIAEALGDERSVCEAIGVAAPMHDIGKIGIPDLILLKPGRLTPEEQIEMRKHPTIGHSILRDSKSALLRLAAELALSHHERWDGGGYPHRLAGTEIPRIGRIVAVADVFDALTSVRAYKPAWPLERARDFLEENRGRHFDPACIDAFIGRWAEVTEIHRCLTDPIIKVPPDP